jgi:hypothetical protein
MPFLLMPLDEYCHIGESTPAVQSMKRFVSAIRACFESQYLRKPTRVDIDKQLAINEEHGWPGMFASIDCIHWMWLDKANSKTKTDIVPSYLRPWQTKVIRFGMSSLGSKGE